MLLLNITSYFFLKKRVSLLFLEDLKLALQQGESMPFHIESSGMVQKQSQSTPKW